MTEMGINGGGFTCGCPFAAALTAARARVARARLMPWS